MSPTYHWHMKHMPKIWNLPPSWCAPCTKRSLEVAQFRFANISLKSKQCWLAQAFLPSPELSFETYGESTDNRIECRLGNDRLWNQKQFGQLCPKGRKIGVNGSKNCCCQGRKVCQHSAHTFFQKQKTKRALMWLGKPKTVICPKL